MKFWQFGSTTAETGNAHHMGLGSTGGGCSNELIFLTSHYGGGDYHAFCWDTSTITQFNAGEWYHMVFVWNTTDSKSIVNEYINSDCSVTSENYPCPQGEVCSQLPGGNGVACRQYEIKKGVCKETNLLNEK